MKNIEKLREIIESSRTLCVFTGAGISVPSGIPDFRSANGLYSQNYGSFAPEEIIFHSFLEKHPDLFYDFYKSKMLYPDAQPNAAHRYFAGLQTEKRRVPVVTQNIDGLHQAAGSREVHELHGSALRNYCMSCGRRYDMAEILASPGVPRCACGGMIRPDVVLYEEPLDQDVVMHAVGAIRDADAMIIVGTSLAVYPAAMYVRYFRGRHLVLINRSETPYDHEAELAFHEDVIDVVEALEI